MTKARLALAPLTILLTVTFLMSLACRHSKDEPKNPIAGGLENTGSTPQPARHGTPVDEAQAPMNEALAGQAASLGIEDSLKKEVVEAARLSPGDPVSAVLIFKNAAERKDKITDSQRVWFEKNIAALRSEALARLHRDFDSARTGLDLRGMLIASLVAKKIDKEAINAEAALPEARAQVLSGAADAGYIWNVTGATGTVIGTKYEEGSGPSGLSMTAGPGFRLVRVKARVANLSPQKDTPYTLWAFEDMKRAMAGIFSSLGKVEGPYRWLDDEFILLVSPSNELTLCGHVCSGSPLAASALKVTSPDGKTRVIALPQTVKSGESMEIDVIFSVPEAKSDYRLLVLGAAPVAIKN